MQRHHHHHLCWKRTAAALVLALTAVAAPADTADDRLRFDQALEMYREGRFSAAFGRFAGLANRGHPDAARIAIGMVRYGRELYGTEWSASAWQLRQWSSAVRSSADFQSAAAGE